VDEQPVNGARALQVARDAVSVMGENDPKRSKGMLEGLPPEELVTAASILASLIAAIEHQHPGGLDRVWETLQAQVAGAEVERDLRQLFGDDRNRQRR
jgi:hypothetical protein